MQLSYRGVSYEFKPSNNTSFSDEIIGQYRGAALRAQYCTNPPVPELLMTLQYRGVSYQFVANYSLNSVSDNAFQDEPLAMGH